jgi:hypothetical protein
MAWIESHQQLRDHPKVLRLSRMLNCQKPQTVGLLHFLWWWALDHAEDGDLTDFDCFDIASACGWEGDAEELVNALVQCGPGNRAGFLERDDDGIYLHDWLNYAGKLVESRRHHAGQKRKHRELYNDRKLCEAIRKRDRDRCRYCDKAVNWQDRRGADGATYDYVDPHGETALDNLVVACRACNAGKNQRTPEQAGYTLLPAPNGSTQVSVGTRQKPTPTVPNTTQPDLTEEQDRLFDDFWDAYPLKDGMKGGGATKKLARKSWDKLNHEERRLARIGVDHYRQYVQEPNSPLVAMATTWLNQERWEQFQEPRTTANGQTIQHSWAGTPSGRLDLKEL